MNDVGFLSKAALSVALSGLAGVLVFSSSVAGAETFADSCGVQTEHTLAKEFRQMDVRKRDTALRAPGNSAGVLHLRCLVLAFSGRKPSGAKQEHQALVDGVASKLRMETWVADEGPTAETWRANFAAKISGLTSRARKQFTEISPAGRQVSLPHFGVEHALGFLATSGSLVKLRAFWWSASASSIVSMSAVEAKGGPLVGSIKQVASAVVPAIH